MTLTIRERRQRVKALLAMMPPDAKRLIVTEYRRLVKLLDQSFLGLHDADPSIRIIMLQALCGDPVLLEFQPRLSPDYQPRPHIVMRQS